MNDFKKNVIKRTIADLEETIKSYTDIVELYVKTKAYQKIKTEISVAQMRVLSLKKLLADATKKETHIMYYDVDLDLIENINATAKNRKILRQHAKEAMASYSSIMTWLLLDDCGDLYIIEEPQGQTEYVGDDDVIMVTGDVYKAHGQGAATDQYGDIYKTQRDYLTDLLGQKNYNRIFN
jgi:hypothetical protein